MCVSGCQEIVEANLSRRGFLTGGLAAGAATVLGASGCTSAGDKAAIKTEPAPAPQVSFPQFTRVVDLTHTYSSEFPHFAGRPARVELKKELSTADGDGWNMVSWSMDEHAGTHVDAPIHRNPEGITVDKIPAADLVLPLVVVDIREKARRNPDAQLTAGDLKQWESKHGPIPARACVALLSGWDAKVSSPEFIGMDDKGVRHFPGFHLDAADFLLKERSVVAIACDTASFDHGPTRSFETHTLWLGAQRWGIENVAGLANVPAIGATLCCGAPKVAGATGGPTRVLALV